MKFDSLIGMDKVDACKVLSDAGFRFHIVNTEIPQTLNCDFQAGRVTVSVDGSGVVTKIVNG